MAADGGGDDGVVSAFGFRRYALGFGLLALGWMIEGLLVGGRNFR
jgi:hypothetical protein